jgi:hypothetical protein
MNLRKMILPFLCLGLIHCKDAKTPESTLDATVQRGQLTLEADLYLNLSNSYKNASNSVCRLPLNDKTYDSVVDGLRDRTLTGLDAQTMVSIWEAFDQIYGEMENAIVWRNVFQRMSLEVNGWPTYFGQLNTMVQADVVSKVTGKLTSVQKKAIDLLIKQYGSRIGASSLDELVSNFLFKNWFAKKLSMEAGKALGPIKTFLDTNPAARGVGRFIGNYGSLALIAYDEFCVGANLLAASFELAYLKKLEQQGALDATNQVGDICGIVNSIPVSKVAAWPQWSGFTCAERRSAIHAKFPSNGQVATAQCKSMKVSALRSSDSGARVYFDKFQSLGACRIGAGMKVSVLNAAVTGARVVAQINVETGACAGTKGYIHIANLDPTCL